MELINKTSSAVAVTASLSTLIDWTYIESFSGFTLFVENAGGGSANNLTDVQIDTSDDNGVTISLDQHADVPAVPITSGNSKKGTFTTTKKYVRIRAKCAADEDTTANAFLLADSAAALLCTINDVKERLGKTDSDHDSLIARIISGIEGIFNSYTDRYLLLNSVAVTEYYTGGSGYLQLRRYPIVSITSIKESLTFDFDTTDALDVNDDYRIVGGGLRGILWSVWDSWPVTPDCVQVVYKGGYCAAGVTPASGEFVLPAELREAAILQSTFMFKRKDDIGLSSVSFEGGAVSKFSAIDLLPEVKAILDKYKRRSL